MNVVWANLRPHEGKLDASFEQLCSILFRLNGEEEKRPSRGDVFIRNGRPDGGVECYWRADGGLVDGMQAKYFRDALGKSQFGQLDHSITSAVESQPSLRRFVICLPRDLSDAGKRNQVSERARWSTWVTKWEAELQSVRPGFQIELWDSLRITLELATPGREGLLKYFFDSTVLTPDAVRRHVAEQIARAGVRFHPDLNVDHPLEALFDWMTWTPALVSRIRETLKSAIDILESDPAVRLVADEGDFGKASSEYQAALRQALAAMDRAGLDDLEQSISEAEEAGANLDWNLRRRFEPHRDQSGALSQIQLEQLKTLHKRVFEPLNNWRPDREHGYWEEVRRRVAVIYGEGGAGKTHLCCEMARRAATADHPVVLAFGQSLRADQLWHGLLSLIPGCQDRHEFLTALNTAGEIRNVRCLLILDAVNESEHSEHWQEGIATLEEILLSYPHVAIIITVRTGYWAYWHLALKNQSLPELEHVGFAQDPGTAVAAYFDHYNIAASDAPPLHPEFSNPLFLSLFCQTIAGEPDPTHSRPSAVFTGAVNGLDSVFEGFVNRRNSELVVRFGLDTDLSRIPLREAVDELAELMSDDPQLTLTLIDTKACLEKHLRGSRLPLDLLRIVESEGILQRIPVPAGDGRYTERVGFAYDRMVAHFVVARWLSKYKTGSDARQLFDAGNRLHFASNTLPIGDRYPSFADAVMVQWPQRYRNQLFTDLPALLEQHWWADRFLLALPLCASEAITTDAPALAVRALQTLARKPFAVPTALRRLLCNVGHPSIIDAIHAYMAHFSMAERDAWWTVRVVRIAEDFHGTIRPFLDFAVRRPHANLPLSAAISYGTRLAWFTGVTDRRFRARATRAITGILEHHLPAAPALLRRFVEVNDPYIVQSVCLAVYGAVLRRADPEQTRMVGEEVLQRFPSKAEFPVDVISRHALAGIVEFAKHLNPGWNFDLNAVCPPYSSSWPKRFTSWNSIIKREKSTWSDSRGYSHIVRSCGPIGGVSGEGVGFYGDFGRYVVSSGCSNFFRYDAKPSERPFELDLPHRFILGRVLSLGWTPDRFEDFDAHAGDGSRHKNTTERIGKKYQWIALHEFLARAADRFPLVRHYDDPSAATAQYQGPWDVGTALPLDPTLLSQQYRVGDVGKANGVAGTDFTEKHLWDVHGETKWLLDAGGFPEIRRLIVRKGREGESRAALLGAYLQWQSECPYASDVPGRRIWLHVRAFAVRSVDLSVLQEWVRARSTFGQIMPDPRDLTSSLFGELYWSRASGAELSADSDELGEQGGRLNSRDQSGCPRLLPLVSSYLNEYDGQFENFSALVPSSWVVKRLKLRAGSEDLCFRGADGRVAAWNTAAFEQGADASFCDLEPLQRGLQVDGLELVWIATGEKWVISDREHATRPQWPWFRGLYWLNEGTPDGFHIVKLDQRPI